jgi:transaldolase
MKQKFCCFSTSYYAYCKCAKIGADVITGPLSAIYGLLKHPLTDIGLAQFVADFEKGNK